MMAIRAAKAFTRRDKILKLEGGYHGTHDAALVSTVAQSATADGSGLFRGIAEDVLSTPANDIGAAGCVIGENQDQLAAIIVEPVMGGAGIIPLEKEFVQFLSEAARACGAVLIF